MLEQFSLDINAAKTTLKYALEYFFPSSLSLSSLSMQSLSR